ncbi:hypothetical protein D1AOALGA4SA_3552 [Olavius algarvensis Delta 1 endosymbiont]|nr:hypothetical protein D1AOALGA4SA_3552 [Olavius algarvensis Delta 1 endosymbiont]
MARLQIHQLQRYRLGIFIYFYRFIFQKELLNYLMQHCGTLLAYC